MTTQTTTRTLISLVIAMTIALPSAVPAQGFDFADLRSRFGLELQPDDFIRADIDLTFPTEPKEPVEPLDPREPVEPIGFPKEPVEPRPNEPVIELPTPVPAPATAHKTYIKNKSQLDEVGLWAETVAAAEYLTELRRTLRRGLKRNRYWLLFRGADAPPQEHVIRNIEGLQLTSVVRVDKKGTKCSSMFRVDDDEVGGGASLENATRGICGVIAVLHSLEKLDLVERDQIVDGDHLSRKAVEAIKKKYQNKHTNQMTKKKLRKAHQDFGTGVCKQQNDAVTSNLGGLDNFVKNLNKYVNDPKRHWDCTLYVKSGDGKKTTLAHYEHVTGMTVSDSGKGKGGRTILNGTVTTMNGFAQGNQSSTVPANPGSNTWSLRPGETPPMNMSDARNGSGRQDDETRDRKDATPPVQKVSFICCPGGAK